jgi:hypothetical protein
MQIARSKAETYFTALILVPCTLIGSLKVPSLVLFAWFFNTQLGLLPAYLFGVDFDHENGGSMFLRNVDEILPAYTVLHPRRW